MTTQDTGWSKDSRARVDVGSACSTAFVFDDGGEDRHAVVTVHYDGSGSIAIYDSARKRLLSSISIHKFGQFRAIRQAIDSQTANVDVTRLRARGKRTP